MSVKIQLMRMKSVSTSLRKVFMDYLCLGHDIAYKKGFLSFAPRIIFFLPMKNYFLLFLLKYSSTEDTDTIETKGIYKIKKNIYFSTLCIPSWGK